MNSTNQNAEESTILLECVIKGIMQNQEMLAVKIQITYGLYIFESII